MDLINILGLRQRQLNFLLYRESRQLFGFGQSANSNINPKFTVGQVQK